MKKKRRRGVDLLTPLQIKRLGEGLHADGGGLMLSIKPSTSKSGGLIRSWVLHYSSPTHRVPVLDKEGRPVLDLQGQPRFIGKRREMGLGAADLSNHTPAELKAMGLDPAQSNTLAKVRERARQLRESVRNGIDPIDAKKDSDLEARANRLQAQKEAAEAKSRIVNTLKSVARKYHEEHIETRRTTKHAAQWISSLETHVPENIWTKPIQDVTATELLELLRKLRTTMPETGSRVQQRLGLVFADAKLHGMVANNPIVDIAHALRESKADRLKKRKNHPSLAYVEVPSFIKALHDESGIGARALEFTICTAARTNETLGATWAEVNLKTGLWTIPASRMKATEEHVVHLSPRAIEILKEMEKLKSQYCFPSPVDGIKPLSNMAMLVLVKRMHDAKFEADKIGWVDIKLGERVTPHGFRASFSSWAYEVAQRARPELAREDVIEACLAHQEQNRIKAAYNRAKFDDDRKELMALWAGFTQGKPMPAAKKAGKR